MESAEEMDGLMDARPGVENTGGRGMSVMEGSFVTFGETRVELLMKRLEEWLYENPHLEMIAWQVIWSPDEDLFKLLGQFRPIREVRYQE